MNELMKAIKNLTLVSSDGNKINIREVSETDISVSTDKEEKIYNITELCNEFQLYSKFSILDLDSIERLLITCASYSEHSIGLYLYESESKPVKVFNPSFTVKRFMNNIFRKR